MANTHSLDLESSSSQYVYRADNASLSQTGDISIECWVKFESLPTNGQTMPLITKWANGSSGNNAYAFWIYNDAGSYLLGCYQSGNGTGVSNPSISITLSTGVWTHLAVSIDVSAHLAEFYKDGLSLGTNSAGTQTSIYDGNLQFRIGAFADGTYFDGLIDEVRLWSDIRTSQEVAANYAKELVGNESNLAGYWKLNNSLLDETANDNDLTGSGSPAYSTDIPLWQIIKALFFAQY